MDYQEVRMLAEEAIATVNKLLRGEIGGDEEPSAWCDLASITFDQSLCSPYDEEDNTGVRISFEWCDPLGEKSSHIDVYDVAIISSDFFAGMIYAKILSEERLS